MPIRVLGQQGGVRHAFSTREKYVMSIRLYPRSERRNKGYNGSSMHSSLRFAYSTQGPMDECVGISLYVSKDNGIPTAFRGTTVQGKQHIEAPQNTEDTRVAACRGFTHLLFQLVCGLSNVPPLCEHVATE